ncbi:hypothetical protein M378DRAFT_164353 [Amanita muscaria Koide BX008]|uniref:Phosphoglycerate mutase-like protein n=1 Tax=Amanita muscaria (strain Koide BX008) TaxID=946122 RepID=A0A0C2TA13_AMAMK|nr:hypothetical protein M378DRAFT_164353 [Amanita muscaria Koide BX008]
MALMTGDVSQSDSPSPVTIRPPQVPLDVEGYPAAPDGLELEQVHIYIRHGERTPVAVRLADPPASIPPHWIMCKTADDFWRAASSTRLSGQHNVAPRIGVERRDGTSVEGECLLGQLTDLGRKSTLDYGAALRRLYIDRLGFLSESPAGQIYLRSTSMPRTIDSLKQIVHGLCSSANCNQHLFPPIVLRNGKDENLIGNTYHCKRLALLQLEFANASAIAFNPTLEKLDKKLSKYIGGKPVRIDGKPRASGILDTIRAATAHGIKVPPEFEDKSLMEPLEEAIVSEWFGDKTEEVRRLGMGPLLADLSRKMQSKVDQGAQDPLKLLIHSTHDTTIAALCSTLDVYDEKWPPFTSSITFELFKRHPVSQGQKPFWSSFGSTSPADYFVRMRYQNKNMVLPACAEQGKHLPGHPEFCTFTTFRARVKELTPSNWEEECSLGSRP